MKKLVAFIVITMFLVGLVGFSSSSSELIAYPYKVVDIQQFDDVEGVVFFAFNEEYSEEVIFLDDQIKGELPKIGDKILAYFDFDSHCIELIYVVKNN